MENPLARARWQAIAEDVFAPAAAATGERSIVLIMRGGSGELLLRERVEDTWGEVRSLGVPVARSGGSGPPIPVEWPISACATGPGEVHLLARSPEGELLHGALRGGAFDGFDCVGAPSADELPMGLAGAPTACSRAPGRMDVFAVGAAGALLHTEWNGAEFEGFESLGGLSSTGPHSPVCGPISSCACGNRMGVFSRGPAGDLLLQWWNGVRWSGFESLGSPETPDPTYPAVSFPVPLASAPVACGGGTTRLDVFARGVQGDLLQRWWDGKTWSPFESRGMPREATNGAPVPLTGISLASAWGRYRLDVFVRAMDGKLYGLSSGASAEPPRPPSDPLTKRIE